MGSKPLRVTFTLKAEQVGGAITELSDRFLRATKTGCRVVQQSTEFPLLMLCHSLIEDWQSGKVPYIPGEITLSFSSGSLALEADLLIYKPQQGDRYLYSRRPGSTHTPHQLGIQEVLPEPKILSENEALQYLAEQLAAVREALAELTTNQRSVESRLHNFVAGSHSFEALPTLEVQFPQPSPSVPAALEGALTQHIQVILDAQVTTFAQIVANQITATARHFSDRLTTLQTHLDELTAQVKALEELGFSASEPDPLPETDAEWLQRFKNTWGTVGDYEQYSDSYREANAATPLFYIPDWIMLCELEWARRLSPTLTVLFEQMQAKDGIGYEGANILHQFGKHIDPDTGEGYYIYQRAGFNAYEALWQTARNGQNTWLSELQRILTRVAKRHPDILQMFGWEAEAIASLETVVERARREQQANYDYRNQQYQQTYKKPPGNTLSDYLALLNLGPFSPLTLEAIKRAYRQAMKTAHPDTGGSKEMAQRINEAYEAVLKHYFPEAT